MKTIRVYLSIFAIVFSVGGAIGSTFFVQPIVYDYIDNSTTPDQCIPVELECQEEGDFDCQVTQSGPVLREESNTATQCGAPLKRTDAPMN